MLEVFEMFAGQWLFRPAAGDNFTAEQHHLACLTPITQDTWDWDFATSGRYAEDYFELLPDTKGELWLFFTKLA